MSNMRDGFETLILGTCQHPGLLFDRFYPGSENEAKEGETKKNHFQKIIASSTTPQVTDLYKKSFERWKIYLPKSNNKSGSLETTGKMVVGLGKASVLEIGIHND